MAIKFLDAIDVVNSKIINLGSPSDSSDADTKGARDTAIAAAITAISAAKIVVSSTDSDLSAWMTSVSYVPSDSRYPLGTILILSEAGDPSAAQYFNNGEGNGTSADWQLLGNSPLASQIRGLFSGENGISYDSGNGKIGILAGLNGDMGDGSAVTFTFNVPVDDVICVVREASTGTFVNVETKVVSGVVTFTFASAPSPNQYKYSIYPNR